MTSATGATCAGEVSTGPFGDGGVAGQGGDLGEFVVATRNFGDGRVTAMKSTTDTTDTRARVFAAYRREAASVLHCDHKGRPIRASVFRALRHMYACGIAQDVARGGEPWPAEVERFRVVDAICARQDARVMRRFMAEIEAKEAEK